QFRTFRMPESIEGLEVPEDFLDNPPAPGEVLCDDGEVAFPGMVDDWFNMLNQGRRIIGVGNSDSHDTAGEEPGYPRTFMRVDKDDPRDITSMDVVDAFLNHRLTLTNGPFVELFVNNEPIGSSTLDNDGQLEVRVRVQAPQWVQVNRANLIANGQTVDTFEVVMEPNGIGGTVFETTRTITIDRDAWIVAEVSGDRSMFPVVTPVEVPPVLLDDAIAALAGGTGDSGGGLSLGSLFGGSSLGELEPGLTRVITAYALTNPIWVDTDGVDTDGDGDNFDPTGAPLLECAEDAFAPTPKEPEEEEGDSKPSARLPEAESAVVEVPKQPLRPKVVPSMWFPRVKGDMHDVRVIFEQLSAHSHSSNHDH
ncbi:MAG: CehA/McbA family metallohydrolase, partial [Myxococcota bacterium]